MPKPGSKARRPPWYNALLLWLGTNLTGAALLLLPWWWRGAPGPVLLMVGCGALLAAAGSLVTIPLLLGLFYLLPNLLSLHWRRVGAILALTVLCVLVCLFLATTAKWWILWLMHVIPTEDSITYLYQHRARLWFVLAYWPAALGCAMYLYHPWLFAPPAAAEEPWV